MELQIAELAFYFSIPVHHSLTNSFYIVESTLESLTQGSILPIIISCCSHFIQLTHLFFADHYVEKGLNKSI